MDVEEATAMLSIYAFIDVIECPDPVAAAETVTGELTVEPFAGAQMTTPAVLGGVQAAEADVAKASDSTETPRSVPRKLRGTTIVTMTPTAETQGCVGLRCRWICGRCLNRAMGAAFHDSTTIIHLVR